jgi:hypothetical protein
MNIDDLGKKIADIYANPRPKEVTVRIPADHPVARRLKKLFELYATETRLPGGVVVQHRAEDPEALNLVIRELRQAVVESGGDPSAIDSIHEAPDPMAHILKNVGSLFQCSTGG